MSAPLQELANMENKKNPTTKIPGFKWLTSHQNCFDDIKLAILQHWSLILPDSTKPYYLVTDASQYALACNLYQLHNNIPYPIACLSRKLTGYETRWSTHRKEISSIIFSLHALRAILQFASINIITDCRAILWLRSCKDSNDALSRMAIELCKYSLQISHIRGKENILSDALSRYTFSTEPEENTLPLMTTAEADILIKILIPPADLQLNQSQIRRMLESTSLPSLLKKYKAKTTRIKKVPTKLLLPQKKPIKKKKSVPMVHTHPLYRTQHQDFFDYEFSQQRNYTTDNITAKIDTISEQTPTIDELFICSNNNELFGLELISNTIQQGQMSIADFITAQDLDDSISALSNVNISFIKGIKCIAHDNIQKPILPFSVAYSYANLLHFHPRYGHMSQHQMKTKLNEHYHILNIDSILKDISNTCAYCQYSIVSMSRKHTFDTHSALHNTRIMWHLDIIGSLPATPSNNKYIYIATDSFSCYTVLKSASSKQAKELMNMIYNNIMIPFGIPQILHIDGEFSMQQSQDFQDFLESHSIEKKVNASYSPWQNAAVERNVSKVKTLIKKLSFQMGVQWDTLLAYITNSINEKLFVNFNV